MIGSGEQSSYASLNDSFRKSLNKSGSIRMDSQGIKADFVRCVRAI